MHTIGEERLAHFMSDNKILITHLHNVLYLEKQIVHKEIFAIFDVMRNICKS